MRIKTHPGDILLEEFLKPNNITPHTLALAIGVSSSRISEITKCARSISADTALRLARYFGTIPQFWLNLQNAYDLSLLEEKRGNIFERIVPFMDRAEALSAIRIFSHKRTSAHGNISKNNSVGKHCASL